MWILFSDCSDFNLNTFAEYQAYRSWMEVSQGLFAALEHYLVSLFAISDARRGLILNYILKLVLLHALRICKLKYIKQ